MVPAVSVPKGDHALRDVHEAVVGNGHPMGIPTEVFQHLLRAIEGSFGVDHPLLLPELGEQAGETFLRFEGGEALGKDDLALGVPLLELIEELAPKYTGQSLHGKQIAALGANKMTTIEG